MTDKEKKTYIYKRIKSLGKGVIGFDYITKGVRKMLDYHFDKGHLKLDKVYDACVLAPAGDLGLVLYFDFLTLTHEPIFTITKDDRETMLNTCIDIERKLIKIAKKKQIC